MKKILKNKLFMTLLGTDLLSNFGDIVYYLALMNYVLLLPDAKFALSLISLSEGLPMLAGLFLGYLADTTRNKTRLIIITQLFRASLYLLVGWAMTFTPALWIVLVAIVVNFLSDLAGQYENGLYMPIRLRIIDREDREAAEGLRFTLQIGSMTAFNAIGAALLGIMAYSSLAYLNAVTFATCAFIMLAVRPAVNRVLSASSFDQQEDREEEQGTRTVRDFIANIRQVFRLLVEMPDIKAGLLILPFVNGLLSSSLVTLLVLVISEDKSFVLISSQLTLALFNVGYFLSAMVGGLLTMSRLKKMTLESTLQVIVIFTPFFLLSLYFHHILLVLTFIILLGIFVGFLNPKIQARLMNSLPEDKMGMVFNGLQSYLTLAGVVFNFLLSALIVVMPSSYIILIFFTLSLLLAVYSLWNVRKIK